MKMAVESNISVEVEPRKMRKTESEETEMRKTEICAKPVEVTLYCELAGYDIKTLNMATGKGSYMLKVGKKTVVVPYTLKKKPKTKSIILMLYKMKGLRGLFRRAAERQLLELGQSPCCPNANYPHQEILDRHVERGYHPQGSCKPVCLVKRLYGSLDQNASMRIFAPFIAKANAENIPSEVTEYLDTHMSQIFGSDHCIVYHNGETTLKVETFNIINRVTELAVNNFMKHTASGVFPFKVVFSMPPESGHELIENIGFFLASLHEINQENGVQIGADKNNGSGQVTIRVTDCKTSMKFPEVEKFVKVEQKREHIVEFCGVKLQGSKIEYTLDPTFGQYALDSFTKLTEI